MSNPTPAELLLLQRTANLVSGKPLPAVSKQFVQMLRDHINAENAKLRGATEEANTQLWHAIEAGAYRGKPLQFAMEQARSALLDALKP